jgi:NAD(P)-dependent dehydrogenase (short-subunit alcohol dehydrogenase family)
MDRVSKAVLITGCSSGIGEATAARLASGWTVYATARKAESLGKLAEAGCRTLALDVTDEASMVAAVRRIEEEHGAVGVLVNNAGYSQSGAVESVSLDRVRRQFETNVFGLLRLTQLCLPGMRRQRWGKVVNVGSMGGKLTFPGGGIYHATKHAVEALSDALRFEVAGFGIDVVLVEPGLIKTGFADAVTREMTGIASADDPYATFNTAVEKATAEAYTKGPLGRWLGGGPDDVAQAIERAIGRSSGPPRVPVTMSARLLMGMRAWMSDRMWDRFVAGSFPRPQLPTSD